MICGGLCPHPSPNCRFRVSPLRSWPPLLFVRYGWLCPHPSPNCRFRASPFRSWPTHLFIRYGGRCPHPLPYGGGRASPLRSWPPHLFSRYGGRWAVPTPTSERRGPRLAFAFVTAACTSPTTKGFAPAAAVPGKIPIGRPWAEPFVCDVTALIATAWRPRPTRAAPRACNPGTRGAPFRRSCGCRPRTAWRADRCCPAGPSP